METLRSQERTSGLPVSRVRQAVTQNQAARKAVRAIRKLPLPEEKGLLCRKAGQPHTQPPVSWDYFYPPQTLTCGVSQASSEFGKLVTHRLSSWVSRPAHGGHDRIAGPRKSSLATKHKPLWPLGLNSLCSLVGPLWCHRGQQGARNQALK